MANDRKKRKIHISKLKKDKAKEKQGYERASDQGGEPPQNGVSRLMLVNGTRRRRRIIRIITYAVILCIIITLIIVNAVTPTGLIESLQNGYAALGGGKFPVNVYSTNASAFYSWNGIHCVMNESFFELYNDNGKLIQAASHGMSRPNIEVSEARYLLFDRDRYNVSVYNYSDELYSIEFDNVIVSADIGRDGTFAVVTDSDTYQNTVYVYNKDNESVYTWNSANFYVTDVAVADDGERIAVCMVDLSDGSYVSYVYILEFDSADPKYRYTYSDVVSSLTSCGENYIIANGFDCAYSLPWGGGAEVDLGISGVVRCYDTEVNGASCVVSGREDNGQLNTVTILNASGNIKSTFEFNSTVTDVCITETAVAVLSGNEIYIYNLKGELKRSRSSATKGLFVGLTEDGEVLVLDNSKLSVIKKI